MVTDPKTTVSFQQVGTVTHTHTRNPFMKKVNPSRRLFEIGHTLAKLNFNYMLLKDLQMNPPIPEFCVQFTERNSYN